MQQHRIPFFGQKTGMILESPGADQPHIFLRFLKKKDSNVWEKPSAKEGKVLKLNLLEIIRLRDLCMAEKDTWSSVHAFGSEKTSFSFEKEGKNIKIALQGYSKFIQYPESELLKEVMIHLVHEKVENATNSGNTTTKNDNSQEYESKPASVAPENPYLSDEIDLNADVEIPEDIEDVPPKLPPKVPPTAAISPKPNGKPTSNTAPAEMPKNINEWLTKLKINGEFYEVFVNVTRRSEKAWLAKAPLVKEFWVPLSVIDPTAATSVDTTGQLRIKKWWIERNLDKFELMAA
jgi:hypothetical protein